MLRTLVAALVLASVPAFAQPAPAPAPPPSKIQLGVRVGFALPFGKLSAGERPLSDSVIGQIPVWVDGLYRVSPAALVGIYFSYGILLAKDCPEGVSCRGHVLRIGPEVRLELERRPTFAPWVALGIGYESITVDGESFSADATGWEFANLQAGADFLIGARASVGPFLSFSLNETTNVPSDSDRSLHMWLLAGARGGFEL